MSFFTDFWKKNGPEVIALFTGGLPWFILSPFPRRGLPGVPVFCYHTVKPGLFEKDLIFLAENGYETLFADELLAVLREERVHRSREVVLSFDDGAVNIYNVAYPLLKKHRMKAVLFIAPGLHRCAARETQQTSRLCTWEELEEMQASGRVDIQSHTLEHRFMARWPTPVPLTGVNRQVITAGSPSSKTMLDDLRMSREYIEKRFRKKARHLAWPQYTASPEAKTAAAAAGYLACWTGTLPRRPLNFPGDLSHSIVRISGEFVRRLPGRRRCALLSVLLRRYTGAIAKKLHKNPSSKG